MMTVTCEACKILRPVSEHSRMIVLARDGYTYYFCPRHVVVSKPGQPIEVDGIPLPWKS